MIEPTRHPGAFIRAARCSAGITQAQLAIRAGTSQAAISRLERGGSSPSFAMLDRLLRMMGRRLELGTSPSSCDDIDIEEIRRARDMAIEQRLQRAFAWNAFAARISGIARCDEAPGS
jgi:transcriptional regulator with XRE-family HTH domain